MVVASWTTCASGARTLVPDRTPHPCHTKLESPMSKPSVDIGRVGIWYGMIDTLPTPEAKRAAQLLEQLGYGALWVAEAVGRDPFVSAGVLLSATDRLAVATGIANIYARDPMT